jgi:formylmethanofuran dehydrogenase subunit E
MVDIEGTRQFHGHMCPGLAIGIRAAEIALREIGPHPVDEEVVAIVEPRIPPKARILNSLLCEQCGEMVMETRARRLQGRTLCIPCFEAEESWL